MGGFRIVERTGIYDIVAVHGSVYPFLFM
jgi:hypothetical protein